MRSYINLPNSTFTIQCHLVIFQVPRLHLSGWAFWEGCQSSDQSGLSFFTPECHVSGRSNVFGFLWSQKEVKHFHDVSRSEATPSSQNHISQSCWGMLCLGALSVTSPWKTCRAVPAPVSPRAQDTHPLQPVGTVGTPRTLHYCWLMESFLRHVFATNHSSGYSHLPELDCAKQEEQYRSNKTYSVWGGKISTQNSNQHFGMCVSGKLKLSGPLGEILTQLCDTV